MGAALQEEQLDLEELDLEEQLDFGGSSLVCRLVALALDLELDLVVEVAFVELLVVALVVDLECIGGADRGLPRHSS